jgi:hypothetical protein
MRKPAEQGVRVQSHMIEGVDHDVVNWMSVSGNLTAQEMAIEFNNFGFGPVK